jgi:integrin alpha FG-GAP repeat containing protein 1
MFFGLRTRPIVLENFAYQEGAQIKHSSKVLNVVPGDFTHSGKLDLLVMGQGKKSKEIDMYLYQSIPNKGFGECLCYACSTTTLLNLTFIDTANPIQVQTSTSSQPIPLDINGDLKIDLLGLTPDGGSRLQVWRNVWDSSKTDSPLFDV